MPYRLEDFKRLGYYEERPASVECFFENGEVVSRLKVSDNIKQLLESVGGRTHGGDLSRQDSAIITAMLASGLTPANCYETFSASVRGQNAQERKNGHYEDYIKRTIQKQVAYLQQNKQDEEKININFAKRKAENYSNGSLAITMCSDVEIETTQWIWPGYIPVGKITILAGDPGMGKSTLVIDLISKMTRGTHLPTGQRCVTGSAYIISAEDSLEDTITPRLIAANANISKVGIIHEVRKESKDSESEYLTFPRDLDRLRNTIISTGCRILVIDPLTAFIEKGADSYKDQDMRRILHPIESIAHETGCAIIIIAHFNKKEETSKLYRVTGSIGFVAAARSVIGVAHTAENQKVLYSLKSNLAEKPVSLAYEIRQIRKVRTDQDKWKGERISNSSGIRWLGEVDYDPHQTRVATPESQSLDEAESFLRQILSGDPIDAETIYSEGKSTGISRSYINKAKLKMGVTQNRRRDSWFWELPS